MSSVAAHRDALRQVAGGQPAGGLRRDPDRPHHLPGHQQRDGRDQQHQREPGEQHGPLHQVDRLLLGGSGNR